MAAFKVCEAGMPNPRQLLTQVLPHSCQTLC